MASSAADIAQAQELRSKIRELESELETLRDSAAQGELLLGKQEQRNELLRSRLTLVQDERNRELKKLRTLKSSLTRTKLEADDLRCQLENELQDLRDGQDATLLRLEVEGLQKEVKSHEEEQRSRRQQIDLARKDNKRLEMERNSLGFYLTSHPIEHHKSELRAIGAVQIACPDTVQTGKGWAGRRRARSFA